MDKVIKKLSELLSGVGDDVVVLMARDVNYKPQIPDPENEGQMIDNPVEDFLAQAIVNTITQWAINTKMKDGDEEIKIATSQIKDNKKEEIQVMVSAIKNKI